MKIAVASSNFNHVTGHAGQARRWLIFDTGSDNNSNSANLEPTKLELTKELTFHHHKHSIPQPFNGVSVVIAKSAGDGFANRLKKFGLIVILTQEHNPIQAIQDYINGTVKPPKPRPIASIFCKIRDRFSAHDT